MTLSNTQGLKKIYLLSTFFRKFRGARGVVYNDMGLRKDKNTRESHREPPG